MTRSTTSISSKCGPSLFGVKPLQAEVVLRNFFDGDAAARAEFHISNHTRLIETVNRVLLHNALRLAFHHGFFYLSFETNTAPSVLLCLLTREYEHCLIV